MTVPGRNASVDLEMRDQMFCKHHSGIVQPFVVFGITSDFLQPFLRRKLVGMLAHSLCSTNAARTSYTVAAGTTRTFWTFIAIDKLAKRKACVQVQNAGMQHGWIVYDHAPILTLPSRLRMVSASCQPRKVRYPSTTFRTLT